MPIVENKDNIIHFDGEPILFPINFLVNEMFIDVDDEPVFWCDAVPKELKAQVDYELSYLKQINEHLPELSEYNSFHFLKNAIENFESSTDSLSTFSIKNIYYDTLGDFLLAIPVRFQFLCSLFLQSYFQSYCDEHYPDLSYKISKIEAKLSKKRSQYSKSIDSTEVKKAIKLLKKELNKLKKQQKQQRELKKTSVQHFEKFLVENNLTETYDWVFEHVTPFSYNG